MVIVIHMQINIEGYIPNIKKLAEMERKLAKMQQKIAEEKGKGNKNNMGESFKNRFGCHSVVIDFTIM